MSLNASESPAAAVNVSAPPARPTLTRPTPRLPREWWDSQRLLGPRGEIKIRHHGEVYSLRLTRLGKLILTK